MKAVTPRFPHLLHGGDYNPEQWLSYPDVLAKDIELMKKAHVNCVSLGIFAWSHLEPEEGVYDFSWLETIIERLYENGIYTILATPSGARPRWMAQKYPEVLRVANNGVRNAYGDRHNHCLTSPIYRDKVKQINTRLAQHFAGNPAVILWHISNEYSGACYCPSVPQGLYPVGQTKIWHLGKPEPRLVGGFLEPYVYLLGSGGAASCKR